MFRRLDPRSLSLARQLLALQAVIVTVLVTGGAAGAYLQAGRTGLAGARDRVLAVARTVATDPAVLRALVDPTPVATLAPLAERVRQATGTDFVVVMSPQGVRYTHPTPARVGGRFLGHIAAAQRGRQVVETFTGTLGPSVRAVVPVRDGALIRGLVAVGITVAAVDRDLRRQVPLLLATAATAIAVAGVGCLAVTRWLRRQTSDLGPGELRRVVGCHAVVLHAIREGLLLLGGDGRIQLANDEAVRLLDLPADATGRRVDDAVRGPGRAALGHALATAGRRTDEIHLTGDRILVVNQAPAHWDPRGPGTVVTLRDHTELQALTGELDSLRSCTEALRSQTHESTNRLHAVVSLIELGRPRQALELAEAEIAVAQELTDQVVGAIQEPVLAAVLIGKLSQASERGVELRIADGAAVPAGLLPPRDLVTIVGNLLDNAIDAALVAGPPRQVTFDAGWADDQLTIHIADSGPGLPPADLDAAFRRGWSTKTVAGPGGAAVGRGLGLALVAQAVRRNGGRISVAGSRFTVQLPGSAAAPSDGAVRPAGGAA